jgi:Spy/CpxP family protein refolding chaperone
MKRSMKALLAAVAFGGVAGTGIAFALPAFGAHGYARGGAMGFHGRGSYGDIDGRVERLADRLDLSKEQRNAMRAIVDKARPQMRDLRDRLVDNRKQLRALEREAKPDEARVTQLADAQGRAIAELIVLRTKIIGEMRGVLTDEQRSRLERWHRPHEERGSSSREQRGDSDDYFGARLRSPGPHAPSSIAT